MADDFWPKYNASVSQSWCRGQLIEAFIKLAKEENRKGVILTCKEQKIHYYTKFGFVNEGESVSDHGGAKWYQMRVVF